MYRKLLFGLAAVLLVGLLAPAKALAQMDYKVQVPFDFLADGKVMKAGPYLITQNSDDEQVLALEPENVHAAAVVLPVITRISKKTQEDPEVVFDKVGNTYYISEIFIPGLDGFLIHTEKQPHTHHSVKAMARAKGAKK